MCGIAGLLGPTAHTEPLIGPMLTAIEHRGPDDFGIWAGDTCAIGMRRLSIIDIAGGHQPMWSADRRFAIVYNGELYNYRELREELSSAGHVFATDSDTEVLLQFLVTAGFANMDAALNRLRGMFASRCTTASPKPQDQPNLTRLPPKSNPCWLTQRLNVAFMSPPWSTICPFSSIH